MRRASPQGIKPLSDAIRVKRRKSPLVLLHCFSGEEGMAVATALLAMTIAFSIASAAVAFSVNTQRGTTRDHNSKEATAAADAGANVALMRLNQFSTALTSANPCIGLSGSLLALTGAEADGWCPQLSGTVGSATYSYRVGPTATACAGVASGATSCVVATGASSGVTRRVQVTLASTPKGGPFSKAGVIGDEDITLSNNANIRVGVGTNGNVRLKNGASICGDIRHGGGKTISFESPNATQCSGYIQTEGNETLPPVSSFMPESIATSNSNYRLVMCTSENPVKSPTGCQEDSYTKKWETTIPWNALTRTIEPAQNSTLTLTGGDYFICRLVLGNNSHLIMGALATVRIFFDTPEHCGIGPNGAQIVVENNADITSSSYQTTLAVMGLYVMGSTTVPTEVVFANKSTNEFVLYAPNSNVYIENNATFKGAIAGKTVTISNGATIEQDPGFEPPNFGGSPVFTRQSYVQCTSAAGSSPNANC
jgi:hypothetical protein